jgi:hypothetical protein
MKKLIISFLVLCAAITLSSCSDDPAASGRTVQELFPLKVGNSWKMLDTDYDPSGNIIDTDTLLITIDSPANDELGFLYYNNNIDVRYQDPDDEHDNDLLIRYPMPPNEILITLDTTYQDSSRKRSLLKLVSENTPVSVPAGTFNCVVYIQYELFGKGALDTTSYSVQSYSFGIGYVQQENYRRTSATSPLVKRNTYSLISATIK